jgi:S-methylmethionine-dependent homocysteine/selenocysteine methylase
MNTVQPHAEQSAQPRAFDTTFADALERRVVIVDGAMGTMLQAADLVLDDFAGLEGCNEILNDTRPDVVRSIHRGYFEAGADAVETTPSGPTCRTWPSTTSPSGSRSWPARVPSSPARSPTR